MPSMRNAKRMVKLHRRFGATRFTDPDFSVISNNCWGAHIYQQAGLPFQTPFIGLWIEAESYLWALENFDAFLGGTLTFRATDHPYPVGRIGEADIHFIHYPDAATAEAAWRRRVERFTRRPARMFVKFCDFQSSREQGARFDALPWPNRVYFTSAADTGLRSAVHIPTPQGHVPNGGRLSNLSPFYFDARRWIETGDGTRRRWTRRTV